MHCTTKYCKVNLFPGDTNLMNLQDSIKIVNKQINHELNANKMYVTVSEIEFFMFCPPENH